MLGVCLVAGGCAPKAPKPAPENQGTLIGLSAVKQSAHVVRVDSSISLQVFAVYKAPEGFVDFHDVKAAWSTPDSSVIRVEAPGRVRALRPGLAWVMAKAEGDSTAASVLVWQPRFFATVDAGSFYTCGLSLQGEAYCWGLGVPGVDAQGNPVTCPTSYDGVTEVEAPCSSVPVRIETDLRFRSLRVGGDGACALTAVGEAYCWRNRPGNDESTPKGVPARPALVAGPTFASLSVSGRPTCGVTPAGEAYCWEWAGQTPGTRAESCDDWGNCLTAPEPVAGNLRFRSVSVGLSHACGISTRYEAYCWGYNRSGEVGLAETGNVKEPRKVPYDGELTSIVVGGERTCALTAGQELLCWGGERGHIPTEVLRGRGIQLSGDFKQFCTLSREGEVQCLEWTPSFAGQPTFPNQAYVLPGDRRFAHLSVAYEHSCAIALDGEVYCWGANYYGELGSGGRESSDQPVKVARPR
jgi:alpha-tubulin suppressor-like RCC1 family protein